MDIGRDKNSATRYTSWLTGGGQPSSTFVSAVETDQGVHMTYFGDSDSHSSYYGYWYSSMIISVNGGTTFHHVSGNGGKGQGYTFVRVHAYARECGDGYYMKNSVCTAYAGSCTNGKLVEEQTDRTQDNHCGTCNAGYYIEANACVAFGGSCANGQLISPQSKRTQDNHCASCSAGYFLKSKTCVAYGGTCANGQLISPQSKRTQQNHCGTCNAGYYLLNKVCEAFAGSCTNGQLIPQAKRTQNNHCGSCDAGYYLTNKACVAFSGTCTNGKLISPQSKRTQNNHCGACNAGYYLSKNQCVAYGGVCANGKLMASQAQRTQDNHCASCNAGYILRAKACYAHADLFVWQKVSSVSTIKKSWSGNNNNAIDLPSSVPTSATYALVDIFVTSGADDHLVFNFAADSVPTGNEWVTRGSNPATSMTQDFSQKRNHLSIVYTGQNDGFKTYYGKWHSSQHLPIKNRKAYFRTNGASSTTKGYMWMRVRAYSSPETVTGVGLSYKEVSASFVEWSYTNAQAGSKTVPAAVSTTAEYVLCDFFFSSNADDHQNFAFSDTTVGTGDKSWVSKPSDNPEGQISSKTQTRQEVTVTLHGQNDKFKVHYGIWYRGRVGWCRRLCSTVSMERGHVLAGKQI